MATRKKTTPQSDPFKPEETVKAGPQAAAQTVRTRKTAGATAPGGSENPPAKPNAPAATHKAPARKPVVEETLAAHAAVGPPGFDAAPHREEISKEAYYRWQHRGCPHGSAHEDWLAAVALVHGRLSR